MQKFIQKNGIVVSIYLLGACTIWIAVMIVLPQVFMLDFSFRFNLPPAKIGGPEDVYTLSNYSYLLFGRANNPEGFNWLDTSVFGKTITAAIFVTIFDVVICYPIAFYLAQVAKGGFARFMVLSLIVPFWVNEILRAFAFRIIFSSSGLINTVGMGMGIWDGPFDFIKLDIALYAGLGYAFILLMISPSPASPRAAPWSSCFRRGRSPRRRSSAGRAACGLRRSSISGSTPAVTGRGGRPTPSCCSLPVPSSSC
jgi:spermidine/putrescine transport system permease protein